MCVRACVCACVRARARVCVLGGDGVQTTPHMLNYTNYISMALLVLFTLMVIIGKEIIEN